MSTATLPITRTDLGNAQRFAIEHHDNARYVADEKQWFVWDGRRWAPDALGAAQELAKETVTNMWHAANAADDTDARKWANASMSASRIAGMLKLASTDPAIATKRVAFDTHAWSLNTQGGVVDLRTGRVSPHDPAGMHSRITNVAVDKAADGQRWREFVEWALPDPAVRGFVHKLVGYSLTGEVGENVFPLLHGSGANGKSVMLSVLRWVLGDYATVAAPDLLMARGQRGHPTELKALQGYRFVTTNEVEAQRRMNAELLKELTGEGTLQARGMYQDFATFTNVSKIWMAANDKPEVSAVDDAVWRRMRLIPFESVVAEQDRNPRLAEQLREEGAEILAWAVEGCLLYQQEGLTPPGGVIAATDEYREESNPLLAWVEVECEVGADLVALGAEMRAAFDTWCSRSRRRKVSDKAWNDGLSRLGCDKRRETVNGARAWRWYGIKLREDNGY